MNPRPVLVSWVRHPLFVVAVILVILAAVARDVYTYASIQHRHQVLTTGTTGGVPWTLTVSNPDGRFCLAMTGGTAAEFGASCGFGPASSIYDMAATSGFPSGANLIFGPAPSKATQVRINPANAMPGCSVPANLPVITRPLTHALPSWSKSGKWFVVATSLPLCARDVTFLDAAGQPVLDHTFS
jgi:hypothetical protein